MKKTVSLFLSVIMIFSVAGYASSAFAAAQGASFNTADPIRLNETKNIIVRGISNENTQNWSVFTSTVSDYYDFTCTSASAPAQAAHITVYDENKNILNYAVNNNGSLHFSATVYIPAGASCYFCIEYDGDTYSPFVTVNQHTHSYVSRQVKAVGDDDAQNRQDGYARMVCTACGSYYNTAVYYSPAAVALSLKKAASINSEIYPTVTVYDRSGAAISPSEYTVSYEDNILPGRAFVTVSFNSAIYDGELTKSFVIIPKKQSITSLKSSKSKSLTVKWSRDLTCDGYEIQYSTSSKFYKSKTKTVTVANHKTNSKTISKLQKKKKYHIRVRAYKYIGSVKYYGSWSAKKKIYIRK